jgi:UDP-N-acetylmuramoyl-tripeptide--D-alanyl-D-alanine ligase
MDIPFLYELFKSNPDITTDSRAVKPGSFYVALHGEKFDGNSFTKQALEAGATCAIIDNVEYYIDRRTVLVNDTLIALQELANYHRRQFNIPILAITGTNGKTTTKELIRSVLAQKYKVHATSGNFNNHIGVPLTLLSMPHDSQIGIIEMGASHVGEIAQLCHIAEPDYGLITNIGKAHLEGFGSFQGVVEAKGELYGCLVKNSGTIFINSGNKILNDLLKSSNVKKISYGENAHGDSCNGKVVSSSPYLMAEVNGALISTNLVGDYNLENVLAAACVGLHFHVPLENIVAALEGYVPSNNRSQLLNTGNNKLLLDCYNANPSSTEVAIRNFEKIREENKIVVLGDMLELGDDSEKEHSAILKQLTRLSGVKVLLVGRVYHELAAAYGFSAFLTSEELSSWLITNPIRQSYVLIKGSRGIQLEKIVSQL